METMTFTSKVKEEICSLTLERRELLSLISGFCKVNGILTLSSTGMSLNLRTENSKIAKMVYSAFKTLFNVTPKYTYSKKMKLDKGSVFYITISDKTNEILEELELLEDGMPAYPHSLVLEERLRYFCAGAFLASGSVNSPMSKSYHLQIVVFTEEDGKYFLKLFNRFKNEKMMNFKMLKRKNRFVLYLKKAEIISTFLSIIYAHECMMEFENIRIEKDFFNSDNRIQVCYNANYRKSQLKGEEQCKEIQYLIDNNAFSLLSEKEQYVAELRLNNQDASLVQIRDLLLENYHINLSKSGINHLFSKIHDCYIGLKYDKEF